MQEKNFSLTDMGAFAQLSQTEFNGGKGKYFIGKDLGLTGCEASINCLPAGQGVPFVHAHKQNEETYIIIEGEGEMFVDGDVV